VSCVGTDKISASTDLNILSEGLCKVPHQSVDFTFRKTEIDRLNIILASFLRVPAPCVFSVCLGVSRVATDEISAS
jgi:hypothetical protein